ncbi:hypothetical protein HMP0721_2147 [Pseudoramibacter alactolyticus ATCC 23263]|uniref:Uncharacterized protein n=1 Tax=Pseudoramibacter alactolyticus ATCC 23263 TaxID=887929 RepID=E6MJG2_9FIRM|nr:hypothetical protein HMP0721_2147 [Pseudoramibacter alactolyticus ATCC 23263]
MPLCTSGTGGFLLLFNALRFETAAGEKEANKKPPVVPATGGR